MKRRGKFKFRAILLFVANKPGEQWRDVLLDAGAEEARVGQLPVPLDGAVLARLHTGYHAAGLLRRDVVHRLFVPG